MASPAPAPSSATAIPSPSTTSTSSSSIWSRVPKTFRTSAVVASVAGITYLANEVRQLQRLHDYETQSSNDDKKKCLSIAFDQLELTQQAPSASTRQRQAFRRWLQQWSKQNDDSSWLGSSSPEACTLSVVELVHLIHSAAQDPQIVSLFGTFGNGMGHPTPRSSNTNLGWSDWEEIRNALTVFRQSHRRHYEPNSSGASGTTAHHPTMVPRVPKKPLYCFAPHLGSAAHSGNPTYYLASVFDRIHLQSHGELELLGVWQPTVFIRPLLQKYGIYCHVVKQGAYKTAPNVVSESTWTKPHKEAVTTLISELDANLCLEITQARSKALLTAWLASKGSGGKAVPRTTESEAPAVAVTTTPTTGLQPHSTLAATNHSNHHKSKTKQSSTVATSADWTNAKWLHLWHRIHESGTFPAHTAWKAGLVDCVSRRHPLHDLLAVNRATAQGRLDQATAIQSQWDPHETDFDHFGTATHAISLADYHDQQQSLQLWKRKRQQWAAWYHQWITQTVGLPPPSWLVGAKPAPRERIVSLNVIGTIDDAKAQSIVAKVRALHHYVQQQQQQLAQNNNTPTKDPTIQCLVLRIVSPGGSIFACEQVSQELQALPVPVVVSLGHVAASGGYYIAAHAHRIFGLHKTLTGSIGVFGVRADFTQWAQNQGIRVEHVSSGSLAPSYSAFAPWTARMQQNLAGSVDRYYDVFQQVVQHGRRLSPETVHHVAQGKVWTGRQAKEVGLLDEVGGYERAVAYAKRTYCSDDDPDAIEVTPWTASTAPSAAVRSHGSTHSNEESSGDWSSWFSGPPKKNSPETFLALASRWVWGDDEASSTDQEFWWDGLGGTPTAAAAASPLSWLWWMQPLLNQKKTSLPSTTTAWSGIFLTVDETSALQALLSQQQQPAHRPSSSLPQSLDSRRWA